MINRTMLDEQTFGDKALCLEVLTMFRDQAPVLISAIEAGARLARQEAAHRLRGSCLAIGAIDLAEAIAAIETEPGSEQALAAARPLCEATLQEIAELLAQTDPSASR